MYYKGHSFPDFFNHFDENQIKQYSDISYYSKYEIDNILIANGLLPPISNNKKQIDKHMDNYVILSEEDMKAQYNNDENLIKKYVNDNNKINLPYNIQNILKKEKSYYVQYKGRSESGKYMFLPLTDEEAARIYKQYAKSLVKNKTKINNGDTIILKTKSYNGSSEEKKTFTVISSIYTIKNQIVNVFILKQLSGKMIRLFTLTKHDCEHLHIKYEEGLQVWPMNLNWININKKQ